MNKFLTGLALSLALVACGGGDDPAGSTPASATFPLEAAYKAYVSAPTIYTYNLTGTCGGWASETTSAPVAGTFEGAPALVATSTLRMNLESCSAFDPVWVEPGSQTVVAQTFYDASLRPLGEAIPAQELTIVYTGGTPIPATVKVGDSAILVEGPAGSISYVVEAETATSVFVKLIAFSAAGTETSTYRLTSAGTLTLLRHEFIASYGARFVLTPR